MRAKAKFYKGIEFVHVGDLPVDQQVLLQHAREPEQIKILIEGKIVPNCIQYKKYSEWFSAVCTTSVAPTNVKPASQEGAVPIKIALSKI